MKTNMNFKAPGILSFSIIALAILGVTTCFTSCKVDNNNDNVPPSAVMAVNASQSSAPQDFYMDNTKQNTTAIAYAQSTSYFFVTSGDHQSQFKTSTSATVSASASLTTSPGGYYSVYFTDGNTANAYQNDRTMPSGSDSRVRFINLSTALKSNVDFAINTNTKLTAIVSGLAYQAPSSYNEISTASNTFTLSASGSSSVLLNIPVTLQAGKIYTIFISGTTTATLAFTLVAEN